MKKTIYMIVTIIMLCIVTGCQKDNNSYKYIKQVAPYLHEIEYNEYTFDENLETVKETEGFGCSSVRNGDFYGRNFDYIFNDIPEFVVKVSKTKNRHASIGIATHFGLNEEDLKNGKYDEELKFIPNFTLDGINDSGVICSHNVVSMEDVQTVTGTNPNGEDLHMLFIPRFVLDNASSADEAIKLLKEKNIYGNLANKYYLHIMIADKDKTYIVEFIDNQMNVQEKQGKEQVMTNYYLNTNELPEHILGYERRKILQTNYDEGNSFEGMWKLMQRVKYSNAYKLNLSENDEWYSEMLTLSQMQEDSELDFESTLEEVNKFKQNYWDTIKNDKRKSRNPLYWITTHNSTYDIANKKLRITVQENYNQYFEYNLK